MNSLRAAEYQAAEDPGVSATVNQKSVIGQSPDSLGEVSDCRWLVRR